MASRKIIFFVIIGILILGVILSLVKFANNKEQTKAESVPKLSIWTVGGTSEEYLKLFEGAKTYIPEIKNTTFDIRVFPNYEGYRDVLLSTLASGAGPDIFMIEAGGDDILANKSVAIPGEFFVLDDYEKRYEDIFLDLLITEGEGKDIKKSIKGVSLGYETLGIFYHKSLFSIVPKTWNDLELLYANNQEGRFFYPANIGMGPGYTPHATDIIALFFLGNETQRTKDLQNGQGALQNYISYANTEIPIPDVGDETTLTTSSLGSERDDMDMRGISTLDLFISGRIGMVIGFPSTIRDIEKAMKRAEGNALSDLILTEHIPQESLGGDAKNIAKYSYFALSKNSQYAIASAKVLSYLTTTEALEQSREIFPYLISPDRTIMATQGNTPLSSLFGRTRLDAFLPRSGEKLSVYQYGLKTEYDKIFRDYIDRGGKIDIGSILIRLQKNVECKIESSSGVTVSPKCLEE